MTKLARIEKIYQAALYRYDGTNCDTALRVKLSNGRRCWLVGYGADYVPATRVDVEEFENIRDVPVEDDGSYEWTRASDYMGAVVHAYRS